jgi:predicted ATP-dependent serine protease
MNFPLPQITSLPFIEGLVSIWGDFGVGKTIFSLQVLKNFLQEHKKILLISTKPIFPYKILENLLNLGFKENKVTEIYNNLNFVECLTFENLYLLIFNLEFFLISEKNPTKNQIDLIIIDSITDLYRLNLNKQDKTTNLKLNFQLNEILGSLAYFNDKYHIEILLLNELTRRKMQDQYIEIQSGGKVMEYWTTLSIKIERTQKPRIRKFVIQKHPLDNTTEFESLLSKEGFKSL